jgi:hypothetical protein
MITNLAWGIAPFLLLVLLYGIPVIIAIYLVIRFLRAHERIASALEEAARKTKGDGK